MTFSRRDFSKLGLAALSVSALAAKIDSKVNGVRIGIQSYSFRTMSLDDAIAAMKELGIGEVELFSGHVEPRPNFGPRPAAGGPPPAEARAKMREETRQWRLNATQDYFTGIKKKFDDAGIMIQSYNLSFREDFTDAEMDKGFEMAKWLGAKFLTASSTLKAAEKLAPFADKHKMVVAMHNHDNLKDPNEFATIESFDKAMAMSKYFKVNLDVGHFVAANLDPIAYIEKNAKNITNLHIKDRKKDHGANVVWGEGDTPIKAVLQLLKTKKINIPANIEYEYRGEDAKAEVKKCLDFMKAQLA